MAINKKDVCVIGIGRFGFSIVEQLVKLKKQVLALDNDEMQLVKSKRLPNTNIAIVDAIDVEGLKALGVHEFNTVIVATSNNIEIVASLIEIGVKHVIAKAVSTSHERVLEQIGVDIIVKPEVEAGIRTALIATNSNFIKYSEQLWEIGDDYVIGSTIVNDISWLGKPLSELPFNKLNVFVVSIKRDTKVILPKGSIHLKHNDIVTLIGKVVNLTKIFSELNDETSTKLIEHNNKSKIIKK